MGAFMSIIAWAVPLTVLNLAKTKRSNKVGDGDSCDNGFPPIYGNMYPPPSPDYRTKYLSEENVHPPKSYREETLYGRTSYFPVDPYFKALNPQAMKTRCPRYDFEVVIKETQQSLQKSEKKWASHSADAKDKKEASPESSFKYEKCGNGPGNGFRFDPEYQDFMMQMKLQESFIPELETFE